MKNFFESRITKFAIALTCLAGNIAFYTWGADGWTGAEAAWDVHPLFWLMCQGLFMCGWGGFGYFAIKDE